MGAVVNTMIGDLVPGKQMQIYQKRTVTDAKYPICYAEHSACLWLLRARPCPYDFCIPTALKERWCAMQEQQQKPTTQTGLISLARGQSHHVALRRGSVISVASGAVLLISRTRLEDTVLTVQVPLHCGGVYCVAVSGTFEVQALKPACLRQMLPAPLATGGLTGAFDGRLHEWLRGWSNRWLPRRLRPGGMATGLLNNAVRT